MLSRLSLLVLLLLMMPGTVEAQRVEDGKCPYSVHREGPSQPAITITVEHNAGFVSTRPSIFNRSPPLCEHLVLTLSNILATGFEG